jgi:hypothetical protein
LQSGLRANSPKRTWPDAKGRGTNFGNIGHLRLKIESGDEFVENDPVSCIPRS